MRALLVLVAAALLGSCGIKGSLFIPERPVLDGDDGSKAPAGEPAQ